MIINFQKQNTKFINSISMLFWNDYKLVKFVSHKMFQQLYILQFILNIFNNLPLCGSYLSQIFDLKYLPGIS